MTPVDPAFLLIPLLEAAKSTVFRTPDDIFDQISQSWKAPDDDSAANDASEATGVARLADLKCTLTGLRRVCETKDIGGDTIVYRYSKEKAIQYLRRKVDRLCKAQEVEKARTIIRILARDGLMDDGKESLLERESPARFPWVLLTTNPEGRIKTTCELVSQYLSPSMKSELLASYECVFSLHCQTSRSSAVASPLSTST